MGVSRETLDGLAERYGLSAESTLALERLLAALEAEPDAPTSERARADALRTHVADSLSGLEVEALREATRAADLGAGAGFPGLVLAAALPEARVDLIESSARKGAVAGRLAAAAGITNATAVAARVEEWGAGPPGAGSYEAVTARALGSLAVLAEYAAPLLRLGGVLVAWKGERSEAEERAGACRGVPPGNGGGGDRRGYTVCRRSFTPPPRASQGRAHPAGVPAAAGHGAQATARLAVRRSPSVAWPRGGSERSSPNHPRGGPLPTGRAPTLARAWETWWRSQTRRAAWARPPPP